jgi:hypothetical protein
MAYRIRGDAVADQHLCVFSDGATDPVFPVRGAGACPDVTRTYRFYQLDPHLCSATLRCGVFQDETDACRADAFCTYPTGGTDAFADLALTASTNGQSGLLVGDATEDPEYPTRYELRVYGNFDTGAGGAERAVVDWYFNDDVPGDPTCRWSAE